MGTPFGLQMEKIGATLDKRPLARALALATETLQGAVETDTHDFWVNADLNVHIQSSKALYKHVKVYVYEPLGEEASSNSFERKIGVPPPERRMILKAKIDKTALAWAMGWVIQALLTSVRAEREDFWVNIDLNVRMNYEKAKEKRANINVYGNVIDTYDTIIVETLASNFVPEDILQSFCESFGQERETPPKEYP
jgi:hypothetical protein